VLHGGNGNGGGFGVAFCLIGGCTWALLDIFVADC